MITIVTLILLSQAVKSQDIVYPCRRHAPEHGERIRKLVLPTSSKLNFFNGYNHCSLQHRNKQIALEIHCP